ncbi:DUF4190 domain-containing protein [Frondihabitans peucedani]|uniref:DUF4190 domain-containing protein n=1 Tax=Frondihabitans peucedani TaxID=598626 RepID=A0ABP8E2J3_9MICO
MSDQTDHTPDESGRESQPPAYGQNPPAYEQNPPAYGQDKPAYGQNPPAYGQDQPSYGQNQPAQNPYGTPAPNPYAQSPYGQGGYGQNPNGQNAYGQNPYGGPVPGTTSPLAIVSMILGIVGVIGGFLFFALMPIAAIILGFIARRRTRQYHQQGAGMALAGIITGFVGVAFFVAYIVVVVVIVAADPNMN